MKPTMIMQNFAEFRMEVCDKVRVVQLAACMFSCSFDQPFPEGSVETHQIFPLLKTLKWVRKGGRMLQLRPHPLEVTPNECMPLGVFIEEAPRRGCSTRIELTKMAQPTKPQQGRRFW